LCRLLNVTKAENERDIYLVFEYMETDLHAVLRANILEDIHKRYIMYQLFRALKYLHSAELLHRDVKVLLLSSVCTVRICIARVVRLWLSSRPVYQRCTSCHDASNHLDGARDSAAICLHSAVTPQRALQPSNLLLNSECLLKLADFGLARSLADCKADGGKHHAQLTDYVATRWYRAPEILLGSHEYTFGVDMWSCGCILGELLTGRPIFPGKSTMNQLDLIFNVTGVPTREEAARIGSPYCTQMIDMTRALSPCSGAPALALPQVPAP
jgi:mitogen-activated protein kinase 15